MNSTIPADLLELKAHFETWRRGAEISRTGATGRGGRSLKCSIHSKKIPSPMILIDTGPLVALVNKADKPHKKE
jgi:hypothetical protein